VKQITLQLKAYEKGLMSVEKERILPHTALDLTLKQLLLPSDSTLLAY
jgi:hypothetical protein